MATHRRPLVDGPPLELVVFRPDDWLPAVGDVSPYEQRSSWSPTPRVFHVESSRSLRVLSEYLGIDPTAEAADRRQLLLAPTSTPGNRRRGVRASAHISPPRPQTCLRTQARRRSVSVRGCKP
jgi:hypothetical protein